MVISDAAIEMLNEVEHDKIVLIGQPYSCSSLLSVQVVQVIRESFLALIDPGFSQYRVIPSL